jgi:Tol biopolymer transport system component
MKGNRKLLFRLFLVCFGFFSVQDAYNQQESWRKDEELRMFIRLTHDTDRVVANPLQMNSNMFCIDDVSNNLYFIKAESKKKCNLFVKKIDGSNEFIRITDITKGISGPAISPQGGEYLAFSYKKGKKEEIFTVNREKSISFIPEVSLPTSCFNPVFLPLSRKLMFQTTGKGNKPVLWSYDMKSNQLTQHFEGQNASFFPDGRKFAFLKKDKKTKLLALYVYDILSSQESCMLVYNKSNIYQPSVSPDGRYIAYVGTSKSKGIPSNYDIYLFDTLSHTTRQLTFSPASDMNPQWSADGQNLFFISNRDVNKKFFNIWKMRAF